MSPLEDGPADAKTSYVPRDRLLPGIPDHVTEAHIVTKVPWRSVQALSCVNRDWRHALGTREVHRATVCSYLGKKFEIVCYKSLPGDWLCLYSARDKTRDAIPPPPLLGHFVVLDGLGCVKSLCVMKARPEYSSGGIREILKGDMYMLDLAGQREWKRCSEKDRNLILIFDFVRTQGVD